MITDLTTAWAGPFTAVAGDILQPLGGAVLVSWGAAAPDGIGDPVIAGTLTLTPGQVFWARATTEAVTARFYLGPTVQGAVVAPSVPVNSALPVITGTAQEGQTLTASGDTWTNPPILSRAWQWRRGGVAISGATASTYTLVTADVGATITVQVTASNAADASAPAVSAATAAVIAAPSLFAFELLNEAGSASITAVPNLRVSVDAGATFFALAAVPGHPGLVIARHADGDKLVISGWAGGTVPAGLRVHYEQVAAEPNSASATTAANMPALFARRIGGPAPVNTNLPGMTVAATVHNAPAGVI